MPRETAIWGRHANFCILVLPGLVQAIFGYRKIFKVRTNLILNRRPPQRPIAVEPAHQPRLPYSRHRYEYIRQQKHRKSVKLPRHHNMKLSFWFLPFVTLVCLSVNQNILFYVSSSSTYLCISSGSSVHHWSVNGSASSVLQRSSSCWNATISSSRPNQNCYLQEI